MFSNQCCSSAVWDILSESRRGIVVNGGSQLSTLGTSRGAPFTMIAPRLFHILSFFLDPEQLKSKKQTNNIKRTRVHFWRSCIGQKIFLINIESFCNCLKKGRWRTNFGWKYFFKQLFPSSLKLIGDVPNEHNLLESLFEKMCALTYTWLI